jgi:formylglycine-generating enzyme
MSSRGLAIKPKRKIRVDGRLVWAACFTLVLVLAVIGWKSFAPNQPRQGASSVLLTIEAEPGPYVASADFVATVPNNEQPSIPTPEGMVWIPGGEFSMGAERTSETLCGIPGLTRDSLPVHRVYVDGFYMDETEVTNEQFEKFVAATGYVTIPERTPTKEEFPDAPAENLAAGSVVFAPPDHPVPLNDHYQWWTYVKGANWRNPVGPESNIKGREKYPVVQIAYDDAVAYANWAGKRLPTEAEWEFAARGGSTGKLYSWGNEFRPNQKVMANTFQGKFPINDTGEDGFAGIAPTAHYAANAYGLYDLAGNVWEWCSDWYRPDYYQSSSGAVTRNPQGPADSFDPEEPGVKKRVHRGGSFLCTDEYCSRYMVGTRGKGEPTTGTNHLGFRCVQSAKTKDSRKSQDTYR